MPAAPGKKSGAATPIAMASAALLQTRRLPCRGVSEAAITVEAAAVAPNTGHAQPNTSGSGTNALAIAGTYVAGMM